MAQCKMCGRKGFFLSVSANGLCKSCEPIVVMDVQQRGRIINDCMKLVSSQPCNVAEYVINAPYNPTLGC